MSDNVDFPVIEANVREVYEIEFTCPECGMENEDIYDSSSGGDFTECFYCGKSMKVEWSG